MRKAAMIGTLFVTSLSLGACATNRYGYDDPYYSNNNSQLGRAAAGAAVGAAAGAALGSVVGGVSTGEGAAVGALAGGAIGAATANRNGSRWYRDNRGYCYYVNSRGERIYDYNTRC